jgi:hypothetical protein
MRPETKRLLLMLVVIVAGILVLLGGCSTLLQQIGRFQVDL